MVKIISTAVFTTYLLIVQKGFIYLLLQQLIAVQGERYMKRDRMQKVRASWYGSGKELVMEVESESVWNSRGSWRGGEEHDVEVERDMMWKEWNMM